MSQLTRPNLGDAVQHRLVVDPCERDGQRSQPLGARSVTQDLLDVAVEPVNAQGQAQEQGADRPDRGRPLDHDVGRERGTDGFDLVQTRPVTAP